MLRQRPVAKNDLNIEKFRAVAELFFGDVGALVLIEQVLSSGFWTTRLAL